MSTSSLSAQLSGRDRIVRRAFSFAQAILAHAEALGLTPRRRRRKNRKKEVPPPKKSPKTLKGKKTHLSKAREEEEE